MTIAVWISAVVVVIVLAVLAENEFWGWSTTVLVLAFAGLSAAGIFNLYRFALEDPFALVRYVLLYVAAGAVWMIIKWWRFCMGRRKDYNAIRRVGERYLPERPVPSKYKERIITWGYLWPFSMIGTIVNDLLYNLWDHIYDMATSLLEAISLRVWKGIEEVKPDGPKARV